MATYERPSTRLLHVVSKSCCNSSHRVDTSRSFSELAAQTRSRTSHPPRASVHLATVDSAPKPVMHVPILLFHGREVPAVPATKTPADASKSLKLDPRRNKAYSQSQRSAVSAAPALSFEARLGVFLQVSRSAIQQLTTSPTS